MHTRVGDRVCVAGESGEFTVMRVDLVRHVVDLISSTSSGIRRIQEGVAITAVRPVGDRESTILQSRERTSKIMS